MPQYLNPTKLDRANEHDKKKQKKNLIKFDFPAARKWRANARYVLANKGQS